MRVTKPVTGILTVTDLHMVIGIDGNEANTLRKVGIGQYAFELLKQFHNVKDEKESIKFIVYLKNEPNVQMPKETENWKYHIVRPRKFWTQVGLPFYLYTHSPKPDVFFSPNHYAPRVSPVPTVVSIMDLSYIYFPDMFNSSDLYQLRNWTRYSVKKASKILTISQASKNDIITEYKKISDDIVVTYPGIKVFDTEKDQNMTDLQKKNHINGKYILFVGTLQPRKNIVRLFEAFKILREKEKFSDYRLVVVGKKGWLYENIIQAPQLLGIENSVQILNFVPDEDMPSLYKNAECFVLPSLYEGFGLPVLEAMRYGCPVVTSNVSSLPEAGGTAALYFDPTDVGDMAGIIEKVLSDKALTKDMVQKGYAQVKKFSWEKTARETLEVLKEVGLLKAKS